jgi:hypothetical protein
LQTFPIVNKDSVAIVSAIPNEGEYYQSGITSTVDEQYGHQNARTGVPISVTGLPILVHRCRISYCAQPVV